MNRLAIYACMVLIGPLHGINREIERFLVERQILKTFKIGGFLAGPQLVCMRIPKS